MDTWSSHPAIADDEEPRTPIIPETNAMETMQFRDRVASFLGSRTPLRTASAIEGVSRPASALSARSSIPVSVDASISDFKSIYPSDVADVLIRDENACKLCGAVGTEEQPLKVTRLIWQSNEGDNASATRSLTVKIDRNDQSNLVTLCLPHAQLYTERKWRFCPIQKDLDVMIVSDQEDRHVCESALANGQPFPPRIHSSLTDYFEVFLLVDDPAVYKMVTMQALTSPHPEYKVFRIPGINPYIVLASCLEVVLGTYRPVDDRTLDLEKKLVAVRESFNKRSIYQG
ncbi:uncharacterized protein EI90DRAFT_3118595 [Cantharellus anzutake]|uniref:uncharacterized protein n=1 Tax=Cantharellus anzutake TaxID=1750568 RepID=UPI0019085253|nr:uncharacterized protein EI90DRAFT_3118595 [Cantharellus anzutake]KAF8338152.1 hypothetical protein EI90DRAFT_3118595 [Cantharellus anzutake]